eukprot:scaffold17902_cov21-Prasinocladus_malaysianus.AAC.1
MAGSLVDGQCVAYTNWPTTSSSWQSNSTTGAYSYMNRVHAIWMKLATHTGRIYAVQLLTRQQTKSLPTCRAPTDAVQARSFQ